jgi:hypothetical protein
MNANAWAKKRRGSLKLHPYNLLLSQAKYFYNYIPFFIIKILVWRTSIKAQNFQFASQTPMFF